MLRQLLSALQPSNSLCAVFLLVKNPLLLRLVAFGLPSYITDVEYKWYGVLVADEGEQIKW